MVRRTGAIVIALWMHAPSWATPIHDRAVEQAAGEIVASRMGALRGGFRADETPDLVTGPSMPPEAVSRAPRHRRAVTAPAQWIDGLARAVDPSRP